LSNSFCRRSVFDWSFRVFFFVVVVQKSRQTSSFQTFLDSTIESRERKKTVENDEKEEFEQRRGEGRGRGRWSGANTIEGKRERERGRVAACFENNDDYKERNRFLTVSFFFFSSDFSKKKARGKKDRGGKAFIIYCKVRLSSGHYKQNLSAKLYHRKQRKPHREELISL